MTLYNYIAIYNGLGLYTISIDFTKCVSDILVLKGDNGSGKTTLSNAMSPTNEPNSDYIPGLEGGKDISYILDDGSILFIKYRSLVDDKGERGKTTCYVQKLLPDGNLLELNPGGNVTEGKDIIFDALGLDSGFVILSQLSSGNRGLVDKKPADRKKFINSIIDSLEAYNEIYKMLGKKSTTLKAMVNSISAKINNLGNIEQIQNNIKTLENTLGDMEDRKVLLIANISTSKEKLSNISNDGNIIDTYNGLLQELSNLNAVLSASSKIIESTLTEKDLAKYEKDLYVLESKKQALEEKLNYLNKQSRDIAVDIESKKIKLSTMGDIELYNSIKNRIAEIQYSIDRAIKIFKSIGFESYDVVSEDEYNYSLYTIDKINMMMCNITENYSYSMIESAFKHLFTYQRKYTNETLQSLIDSKDEANRLLAGQEVLRQNCKDFDSIPSDCTHTKDCPFITSIVSAKSNMISDKEYNDILDLVSGLDKDIKQLRINIEREDKLVECITLIKQTLSILSESYSILSKFPNMKDMNEEVVKKILLTSGSIDLDTKLYMEYSNLIGMIKSNNTDLKSLKEQLSSIEANKNTIDILTEDIEKLTASYNNLTTQKDKYIGEVFVYSSNIIVMNKTIEDTKYILQEKENIQFRLDRKKEIELELPKLNSAYLEAQRLNESINIDMVELTELNTNSIPNVNEEISKNKYRLVLHEDYTKEYNEYCSIYDKVEVIKYYSSPTTGIQTIIMESFMNDILTNANKLLSMFFNGEYVLHPFVINEKEFKIPCLGQGIKNDDVSSMSTSQVCMISMILSFVLLRKVSDKFGIIKLDEIDGGLDTRNRLQFIIALRKLMGLLNYSQCVLVSHNTELGMYDADIIVLKNSDPNLKLDGNVIYQY